MEAPMEVIWHTSFDWCLAIPAINPYLQKLLHEIRINQNKITVMRACIAPHQIETSVGRDLKKTIFIAKISNIWIIIMNLFFWDISTITISILL